MIFDSVSYFLNKDEVPESLVNSDVYSIYTNTEEEYIDSILLPLFEGGGVCNECFKEWVDSQNAAD